MGKTEYNNEAKIEARLIEVLGEGHNQWTYRSDIKSEQGLWDNLRQKINQNNLSELGEELLTDLEFERVKTTLLTHTSSPYEAAKWLKGESGIAKISIEREDNSHGKISLTLYSNKDIGGGRSTYEVVNQIAKQRGQEMGRDRRFDVTLLINGLPIVQIELKQISAKDGVYQAFNQIKKYAEEGLFKNNIFSTVQLFVVSNEQTTRYFANAMPKDMHKKFVFGWRTKDNIKVENIYEFCKQVLNIPDAHRLIANYTVLSEEEDKKTLMVLHPYQVHAIEKLFEAANKHKSGYVWHATGSGKTLTSFVATKLLAKKSGIDRTIMLLDRKDLDNQTTSEFTKFATEFNTGISSGEGKANTLVVGTKTTEELSAALEEDSYSDTIIITTRQKLEAALKYAQKDQQKHKTNFISKLKGKHIVFIVDECHRALSDENMTEIKKKFPNSTWFGFTGTPICVENRKQSNGKLARTTFDQYGEVLHTYTIKNALDDASVLGFQIEHDDTIHPTSLANTVLKQLQLQPKYFNHSIEELNRVIDEMNQKDQEAFIISGTYENDEHIQHVIRKILRPDNSYIKFDFLNGRPQKSAILTTNSIGMAKRYYWAIKEMTREKDWMQQQFPNEKIREGRTIDDADFPRIAITYSLDENNMQAAEQQREMETIIGTYNNYYGTSWSVKDISHYNGDVNNRLARKKAEFQQPGKQIDLVIVVERLLTGFDSPTIQTLFVDRSLKYAPLIQAFSRTNRTYPGKTKGLIVTFRKKATMEKNVIDATRLYSEEKEESGLIYPTYKESKNRLTKAYKKLQDIISVYKVIDENLPLEIKVEYVKAVQECNKSYEAIVTYDEYNNDIITSKSLQQKVFVLEEQLGIYQTIKGSLVEKEESETGEPVNFSGIEFYGDSQIKMYDIDSAYIAKLLGEYSANNKDIRQEIEKALQKLNKAEIVKTVYTQILNEIDKNPDLAAEDIFSIKRRFFTKAKEEILKEFSNEWFVEEKELLTSALQYTVGAEPIPNMRAIIESKNFEQYKKKNLEAKPFKYPQDMKRNWRITLDEKIVLLENELK
ncbi:MAG: type I restriction endonuclease subunit R [Culicoidibacterales bacterium]